MKLKLFLLSLVIPVFCFSQEYRYTNTLFSNSTKTSNVVYGNAPFIGGTFFYCRIQYHQSKFSDGYL